jgi:hypothetical protein
VQEPLEEPDFHLRGWLSNDKAESNGQATVRDGQQGIEVIVVRKAAKGYALLDGTPLPLTTPDDELGKRMARNRLTLPNHLSRDEHITALEEIAKKMPLWQKSDWLRGELFLVLDGDDEGELCGYRVEYSEVYGLKVEKN